MNMFKSVIAAFVAIGAMALLSGCYAVDKQDVAFAEHSVIQTEYDHFLGSKRWIYKAPDGTEEKMQDCDDVGLFDLSCAVTSDGSVVFEWRTARGGITSESITVNGVELPTECIFQEDSWSKHICIPIP